MAFESLYEFPNQLKERYLRYAEVMKQAARDHDKEKFMQYAQYQTQIMADLRTYMETALKPSRWRYQRQACQKIIDELSKV